MKRMSSTRQWLMAAAMLGAMAGPGMQHVGDFGGYRPWRPKLKHRHVSVAAMKRHARKRRNVRARSAKR
jgi:hypothetical protein